MNSDGRHLVSILFLYCTLLYYTAAQFTYNRERNVALSNFMDEQGGIPEEDEGDDTDEGTPRTQHRSSLDYTRPKLNDVDEGNLFLV